ncbi:unnamed protein product [Owenia fusiformis]|uniref:Uncharacterized protein n=1 Tax=Owenia fusiformis TaxID=6347 RepID=A0A8S4N8D4_OWEFU|nr:unnamed protein product [Owenia fusiformis]
MFICDRYRRHGQRCCATFPKEDQLKVHCELCHSYISCEVQGCKMRILKSNPDKIQRHKENHTKQTPAASPIITYIPPTTTSTTSLSAECLTNTVSTAVAPFVPLQPWTKDNLPIDCPPDIFDDDSDSTLVYDPMQYLTFDSLPDSVINSEPNKYTDALKSDLFFNSGKTQCVESATKSTKKPNTEEKLDALISKYQHIVGLDKPIVEHLKTRTQPVKLPSSKTESKAKFNRKVVIPRKGKPIIEHPKPRAQSVKLPSSKTESKAAIFQNGGHFSK